MQSQVDEREVDLEHNIQHVKEKGEGSSLEIRFKKCEQFQILVEWSEKTKIVYVNHIYTSKYKKLFYYRWIKKIVGSKIIRKKKSIGSWEFQGIGASRNLSYIPIAYTSIEDIMLEWENFQHFYDIIFSNCVFKDHALMNYPKQTHFS